MKIAILINQLCEWKKLVQNIHIINMEILRNASMNESLDNKALFSHKLEFMEAHGNYRHNPDVL